MLVRAGPMGRPAGIMECCCKEQEPVILPGAPGKSKLRRSRGGRWIDPGRRSRKPRGRAVGYGGAEGRGDDGAPASVSATG